jgi:hypothetical protein
VHLLAKAKKYYVENKERIAAKMKAYYAKNKEHFHHE